MDSPCEGSLSTGPGNCPWTSEDLARELQNHRRPWKISCTAVTVGVAPCLPPGPAVSRSQFCCPLHTVLKVEDACCICHISSLLGHLFRPMTNFQERYYLRYLQLDTQLLQGLWNNDSEIVIHVGTISVWQSCRGCSSCKSVTVVAGEACNSLSQELQKANVAGSAGQRSIYVNLYIYMYIYMCVYIYM